MTIWDEPPTTDAVVARGLEGFANAVAARDFGLADTWGRLVASYVEAQGAGFRELLGPPLPQDVGGRWDWTRRPEEDDDEDDD